MHPRAAKRRNKTFAPRRHGESGNKWGPIWTADFWWHPKTRAWIFRTSLSGRNSRTRKFCLSQAFSDPNLRRKTDPSFFFLLFSVSLRLRGAKVLSFGRGESGSMAFPV